LRQKNWGATQVCRPPNSKEIGKKEIKKEKTVAIKEEVWRRVVGALGDEKGATVGKESNEGGSEMKISPRTD